jgi:hypothetical protein
VPQCMARPRGTRRISESDERESCINVAGLFVQHLFAPDHHGYPRATTLTSGKPQSLAGYTIDMRESEYSEATATWPFADNRSA